jgi:peptidylprolyl isomerase
MFILIGSLATVATGCKDENSATDSSTTTNSDEYVTLDSGLKYKDTLVGKGETTKKGDKLSMHYTGTLDDGTKFDSSIDRGAPFNFTLGVGQVIQGWDVGVEGMKVGGKRTLVIPYNMAYGEGGIPGTIPGKATLNFDVEVLEIL